MSIKRRLWIGCLAPALLGAPSSTFAQTFDSGSNGSDGALTFAAEAGTVVFNPASFTPALDADGDDVYHFTTITIPAGVTVRLSADVLGNRPVYWLATGAVQINGHLNLDGVGMSSPGAGGWPGGAGYINGYQPNKPGGGPGGGQAGGGQYYDGGGAGHATAGNRSRSGIYGTDGGPKYGTAQAIPLLGGSGGGGAGYYGTGTGSGGAGGGAILVASSHSIAIAGQISARGANGEVQGSYTGGGGSGGAIKLMAPTVSTSSTATLSAAGGSDGSSAWPDSSGSHGRIRIETFSSSLAGTLSSPTTSGLPGFVFPPSTYPSIRVTHVGGVAVTASPTGSFTIPDVAITADPATAVTVQVEARNIPVGTVLSLTFFSTDFINATVEGTPTPLAGTLEVSTASAQVKFPSGFTRVTVKATW